MHPLLFGFLVVGPWWLPILQTKVGWGDPNTGPTAAGVAGLPTRNQTRHLPTWDKTRSSSARFQDNFLRFQVFLDAPGLPQLSRISHTGLRSRAPPRPRVPAFRTAQASSLSRNSPSSAFPGTRRLRWAGCSWRRRSVPPPLLAPRTWRRCLPRLPDRTHALCAPPRCFLVGCPLAVFRGGF